MLCFKVPLNFLNMPKIKKNYNIKDTGNLQAVRVSTEFPCTQAMWKSMTILEFNMDLSIFNDANMVYQEGKLRLFSEFYHPFECFVKADVVKDIASMSTYQVNQTKRINVLGPIGHQNPGGSR